MALGLSTSFADAFQRNSYLLYLVARQSYLQVFFRRLASNRLTGNTLEMNMVVLMCYLTAGVMIAGSIVGLIIGLKSFMD